MQKVMYLLLVVVCAALVAAHDDVTAPEDCGCEGPTCSEGTCHKCDDNLIAKIKEKVGELPADLLTQLKGTWTIVETTTGFLHQDYQCGSCDISETLINETYYKKSGDTPGNLAFKPTFADGLITAQEAGFKELVTYFNPDTNMLGVYRCSPDGVEGPPEGVISVREGYAKESVKQIETQLRSDFNIDFQLTYPDTCPVVEDCGCDDDQPPQPQSTCSEGVCNKCDETLIEQICQNVGELQTDFLTEITGTWYVKETTKDYFLKDVQCGTVEVSESSITHTSTSSSGGEPTVVKSTPTFSNGQITVSESGIKSVVTYYDKQKNDGMLGFYRCLVDGQKEGPAEGAILVKEGYAADTLQDVENQIRNSYKIDFQNKYPDSCICGCEEGGADNTDTAAPVTTGGGNGY